MPNLPNFARRLTALVGCGLLVALFFAPANLALYNVIIFPCPDARTPDVQSELAKIRTQHIDAREVTFPSKNGSTLHGMLFQKPGTRKIFLVSHGKGNNIYLLLGYARILLACGASVFMYDYQGYGRSQGRTTIEGTCEDALAAYDFVHKELGREGSDIIAVGQSWGSGPTGQLVKQRKVAGVVLHAGFSSLCDVGRDSLFWLRYYPDWSFPRAVALDNTDVFAAAHAPLLIVHSRKDNVIPFIEAERLYARASAPKSMLVLEKGHTSLGDGVRFRNVVSGWLASTVRI
jgi:fermentation-respiration switch protein FrsA (DUF1100 family)